MIPLYPWDNNEKPYFVNAEGFEWYVDKSTTEWATKDVALIDGRTRKGLKNVVAFFVKKGESVRSVLINNKQEIVAEHESFVGLCSRIDMLKVWEDYATHEDRESLIQRKNYVDAVADYASEEIAPIKIHSKPNEKGIY